MNENIEKIRNSDDLDFAYSKEDGVVICGDAEEVLSKIPERSVHLIITSPPYNTGINYGGYNDKGDIKLYFDKMRKIFTECYRVLVTGGRIVLNVPSCISQFADSRVAYLAFDVYQILKEIGFIGADFCTWLKMSKGEIPGKSTSWGSWCSPSSPALRDASEYIVIMFKETRKLEGDKDKIDITPQEFLQFTTNVWFLTPKRDNGHPAPFPKGLPYRAMKLYSYQENLILDPFVGSGTTCLVAKENKRYFIGIDISRKYCELAAKRLGQNLLHF
jgi:DNA modification methylase